MFSQYLHAQEFIGCHKHEARPEPQESAHTLETQSQREVDFARAWFAEKRTGLTAKGAHRAGGTDVGGRGGEVLMIECVHHGECEAEIEALAVSEVFHQSKVQVTNGR